MDKKCILPWIHLQVDSDGSVMPCCNANKMAPRMGNVLTENVVELYNNERYVKLRQQMIDGIEPIECKPCYDSERLGLYSKRQRENVDWEQYSHLMNNSKTEFKIRHLDVRFDNVCNFKCRYCSPWLSHSWYNDYIKLNIPVYTEQAINVNSDQLFEVIKNNCVDDLECVFFCGGEPLLMDGHLKLLQLLDSKKKYDTKLLYISNLSKLSYRGINYIDIWKKFSDVNLHFSVDCIGDKFEYIRSGSNYKTIENNMKFVFENKDLLKPKISITVSVFNCLEVLKTVEYFINTGYIEYTDIALHVVRKPEIYSVKILPNELKTKITKEITEFLNTVELPEFFKSRYMFLINFMNSEDLYESHKKQFIELTSKLDDIRNESFRTTFPELEKYYD